MKRVISAILSLSMLAVSVTAVFAAPSDIPYDERTVTVDIDSINSAVDTLHSDLKKSNNKDKVFEDYNTLLDIASRNGDVRQINMIELEKLNYDIPSSYDRDFLNENIDSAVKYGNKIKMAVKSILDSRYAKDFTEYWGEDKTEHIKGMHDNTEGFRKDKSFYDRYFALLDADADSIEFTKLLKELIIYNSSIAREYGYDNYIDCLYAENNTGFTTEDVMNYVENTAGDYYYYVNKFKNYGSYLGLDKTDESVNVKDPLTALSYVEKIDPSMKSAYEHLVKNKLLFLGTTDKMRGATAAMPSYGDAGIIVSGNGAMQTLIHEFGHYQSFINTEFNSEDLFFGVQYDTNIQEFNSQAFELISTGYYGDIYGENADGMKFRTIISLMQQLSNVTIPAAVEITLYSNDITQKSDEDLNNMLKSGFGEEWYKQCSYFFINEGVYIDYSLMLFNAIQLYDIYLKDSSEGIKKYIEACSYQGGSYNELTERLGLVSAFSENAGEYLEQITDDIFKTEYNMDYKTALDYFENKTYLGKVTPTAQRVSVNGGSTQTLYAYNSNGFNYIRIRDLAMLLNGTEKQFDVEYDESAYTVNIITNKPYSSDGTEMTQIEEIKTAGQKNNGTFTLMRDGEPVLSGGAMFINGWNCYLLRGLVERGILDLKIDYDAENDVVMIWTK